MSRRLSMSRIGLAHECSYWARNDLEYSESPSGRAARIGSLVHLFAEALVTGRNVKAENVDLEELAEARGIMTGPFRAWIEGRKWRSCEEGLRYDASADRAEVGPRRGEPRYDDHGPMVLKGTLDLVADNEDGSLDVIDIKTGQKQHTNVDQLYAQAVAASRRYGVTTVRVGFVFPRKTKCDAPEMETLDADRLDEEAGRIRRTLRLLPTSGPEPGKHCWKCPLGWTDCPARDTARDYEPEHENAYAF